MSQRLYLLLFIIAIGISSILLLLFRTNTQNKENLNTPPLPPIAHDKLMNIRIPIPPQMPNPKPQPKENIEISNPKIQRKENNEIPIPKVQQKENIEKPTPKVQQKEKIALPKSTNVILDEFNNKNILQDDPKLIEKIKAIFLKPPSSKPYALKNVKNDDPSMGQSKEIRKILGEQKNGFFIECGALDGETRSNTLVFEKKLGWSGLLIEGDPKNFALVQKKNRKSWSINTCLSSAPYPNTVLFQQHFNIGKISKLSTTTKKKDHVEVQCLPLFSILVAMNISTVDYFSLDVEGLELEVLKTIPWDRVIIKTLSVEFQHGKGGKYSLVNYMLQNGYYVYSDVTHPGKLANDFIFYRKDILPNQNP